MLGKKKKQKLSAHPDFLQKVDEEFEKVGTFRAVPVKSKGVVGEGAVDFTEIEEALVFVKQQKQNPDFLQKVDEEFEKGRNIRAVQVKSIGVLGEGAINFKEIEEALVLVKQKKQKLSAHPDFLQKVDEEFEKGRII